MNPSTWAAIIGGNVAACRGAAKITQAELAKRAETTVPAISRLESGDHLPSLATLLRVAESLGVDPCRLLEKKSGPKPRKK